MTRLPLRGQRRNGKQGLRTELPDYPEAEDPLQAPEAFLLYGPHNSTVNGPLLPFNDLS